MNPVVHFEMSAEDSKRMAEFYATVFGWKPICFEEEMGNYVTVSTAETDENGMVKTPGAINGGFYPRRDKSGHPSVVISVDNISESIKKVIIAGGKVIGEPVDIPGIGLYVSFIDTEGNKVTMLQPKK
jgi:predicted enzyme related to lactoylglutathione lyase